MLKIKQYKYTCIVIVLILIAVLMPGDSVPSVGIPGMDKIVHFGMFFVLSGVYCLEYTKQYRSMPKVFCTLLSLGLFALITEILQLFAINRSFDLKDLGADATGVVVAFLMWKVWVNLIKNKKSRKC